MPSIRDLFVSIGFRVDKQSEKSVNESVDKIKKKISSISDVPSNFSTIANDVSESAIAVEDLSDSILLAGQMFEELSVAAEKAAQKIKDAFKDTPNILQSIVGNAGSSTEQPYTREEIQAFFDDVQDSITHVGAKVTESTSDLKRDMESINLSTIHFRANLLDIEGIFRRILSLGALKQAASIVEDFTQVNLKLGSTAEWHGEDASKAQKTVLEAAQGMRTDYRTLANQTTRLMNTTFGEVQSSSGATDFIGTLVKALRASGMTPSEYNSIVESVTSDVLNLRTISGSTFQKLFAEAPQVEDYFRAAYPGWSEVSLRKIQQGGEVINFHEFYDVIMSNADDIDQRFSKVKFTLTDALTYIKNDFGYFLNETDDGMSVLQDVSKWLLDLYNWAKPKLSSAVEKIGSLIESLGGIVPILKNILYVLIAIKSVNIVVGIIGSISKIPDALENTLKGVNRVFNGLKVGFSGISNGISIVKSAGLKTTVSQVATGVGASGASGGAALGAIGGMSIGSVLAIVAGVVAAIAAIVDFVKFLNGEGSVIGKVIEKLGFDVDDVRDKIKGTLSDIKDRFVGVFSTIASTIGGLLKSIFNLAGSFVSMIRPLIAFVGTVILHRASGALKIIASVLQLIATLAEIALKPIISIINWIAKLFGFGDKLINEQDGWMGFLGKLEEAIDSIADTIVRIVDGISALFKFLSGGITWDEVKDVWSGRAKVSETGKKDYLSSQRSSSNDSVVLNKAMTGEISWEDMQSYFNGTYQPSPSTISRASGKGITVNQQNKIEVTYNVDSKDVARAAENGQRAVQANLAEQFASALQYAH